MPGLSVEGVEFGYRRGAGVLRGVACELPPGTLTAIIGPNGAGKSTLLRLMLGTLRPWTGRVLLDGRDVGEIPAVRRARLIAYIPQHSSVALPFSAAQVVRLGRYAAGRRHDEDAIRSALGRVGLAGGAETPFGELSAGQRQRVTLARALAQLDGAAPGVMLCDEPVSAMDPAHALEAMGVLRERAAAGLGVAVVLHDLSLVARFADRAVVLSDRGRCLAVGPAPGILSPALLEEVFGVRFAMMHGEGGPAVPLAVGGVIGSSP